MPLKPDYETAYKIVQKYWDEGYSKRQAILEADVYGESTVKNNWRDIWEKNEEGEFVLDSMEEAMNDFKDRIIPFAQSKLPKLIMEYLEIAQTSSDSSERRKAIEFLLETVGEFTKTEKLQMEIQNEFENMGPEGLLDYIKGLPGVEVDEQEFVSGMFAGK